MADNRQFTDHNEIGGVNVYLEDKKLAESPEKNTVASTDYVLLKNTEGVPQKISKANLMGVVKDALEDLLKSNDLGTSVTNVPALNASAFGSATIANLASVLGGLTKYDIGSSEWISITINNAFGYIYLLGVDPSTGATEEKVIMARDYNGSPYISGIQAHLQIKKKDNTYYLINHSGYVSGLAEIINRNCTVTITPTVPSDATDVTLQS